MARKAKYKVLASFIVLGRPLNSTVLPLNVGLRKVESYVYLDLSGQKTPSIMRVAIIILLIIFETQLPAQDYFPMLGETNEWHVLQTFEGSSKSIYATKGDTVFNGVNYKVFGLRDDSNVYAYLREDISEQKVYALIPSLEDSTEIIYIDFSLEEGDSIYMTTLTDWNSRHWCWVDSIREVSTITGIRKAYYLTRDKTDLDFYEYPIWIQGIGTIGNPIYRIFSVSEWNLGELACSFKDGQKTFHTDNDRILDNCEINTVNVESNSSSSARIYPNPANSKIIIEPINDGPYTFFLLDSKGKLLIRKENPNEVSIQDIASGLYFVVINSDSEVRSCQLIISH